VTIKSIVSLNPSTEIIDILCEWLMFAGFGEASPKSLLYLPFEFFKTYVIDCVFEARVVLETD
jgi:hypothetical protein